MDKWSSIKWMLKREPWFQWAGCVLRDCEGKSICVLADFYDVTANMAAEVKALLQGLQSVNLMGL
ncbi:hypothetical protein LguiA_022357 [Lonicera macranthoides]